MNLARMQEAEEQVAQVVDRVLRNPAAPCLTSNLALAAGYHRSHWSRVFRDRVGESPAAFVRRIRIEKAQYRLTTTADTVDAIGFACGYENGSAFCRAFRGQVGCSPQEFRRRAVVPETVRVFGIHWNPTWDTDADDGHNDRRFPFVLTRRSAVRIAAVERLGNYAHLGERYEELQQVVPAHFHARNFFTIYWHSLWTHPTSSGMKATIGFELLSREQSPDGFAELMLPGGRYVTMTRAVRRTERHDAWSHMTHKWTGATMSFDEHVGLPIPWVDAQTQLWCRLSE